MESLFDLDLKREHLLRPLLDLRYKTCGYGVERSEDLAVEKSGIDVWLTKDEERLAVDEKAATHWTNRPLDTIAIEVNSRQGAALRTGWLFDPKKKTEAFSFVHNIRLHEGVTRLTHSSQVASCEIVLVQRVVLREQMERAGLDLQYLWRMAHELRRTGERELSVQYPGDRIVLSKHLREEPTNVLMKKDFILSIGEVLTIPTSVEMAQSQTGG